MTYPTKKLGSVVELQYGKGIARHDRDEAGSVPIYGANGILGRTKKALVSGKAIIIGRKGSAGELTRVAGDFWPSDVTYYVFGNNKVNIDYLYYFLKSSNLPRFAVGVKPGINRNRVYELQIPIPPLPEQKKIVARIEKQFAKIDEAVKLREQSAELAAQLLPAALHEVFEEGKEWGKTPIGQVCHINPSKGGEIGDLPGSTKVSFVPMSAVNEYSQNIEREETRELYAVRKGYTYFKKNDVLFAKITPCMENGKVAQATNLKNNIGFGSTEFHVLRGIGGKADSRYIYHIIRSNDFRKQAEQRMTGSAGQKRVPKEFLEKYVIPLPSLTEQKKIVQKLDALAEKVRTLQELQKKQAEDLKALKQSILREVFSGKG